jgi:hypothetical protein
MTDEQLEAISACEASITATQKCLDLESQLGILTEKKYKHYTECINASKLQLLRHKGELPELQKTSNYDAFGCRKATNAKRPGVCDKCKKDFKNLNQHICKK